MLLRSLFLALTGRKNAYRTGEGDSLGLGWWAIVSRAPAMPNIGPLLAANVMHNAFDFLV